MPWRSSLGPAGRAIKPVHPARTRRERLLSRASVLLADDHEEFLAVERRLLEPEFEVLTAVRDGQEAVEEAARLEPDLLVLDVSMPILDGIGAALSLRAAGSRAKIVFLTVYGDPDYVRAA